MTAALVKLRLFLVSSFMEMTWDQSLPPSPVNSSYNYMAVFSGLTCKRGERPDSALCRSHFLLYCKSFSQSGRKGS